MKVKWDALEELLLEKTGFVDSRSTPGEIIARCFNPACELSSTKNKGHLYIKKDDAHPVFHCFKCESSGSIGKLIKILHGNISKIIDNYHSRSFTSTINIRNVTNNNTKHVYINNIKIPDLRIEGFEHKHQYMHTRLDNDTEYLFLRGLVYDIDAFFTVNNIKLPKFISSRYKQICSNYVGFVTDYGHKIILRNVVNNKDWRYIQIPITTPTHSDFYSIYNPNNVKIDSTNTIVLCEGIFSMLCAYYSPEIKWLKDEALLWTAIGGKGYAKSLAQCIRLCKVTTFNVVVLSDPDVDESFYRNLYKQTPISSMDLLWNKTGLDFGVKPVIPCKQEFKYNRFIEEMKMKFKAKREAYTRGNLL